MTKYNWKDIPYIKYVAKDKNGQIFGYDEEPFIDDEVDEWVTFGNYALLNRTKENDEFDWRNSLEARPSFDMEKDAVTTAIKNILQDQDFDCGDEILCSVIADKCTKEVFRILFNKEA